MKAPDKESKRSKRRANRGFKSLEISCRKHKRVLSRSISKCTFFGKTYNPGDKADNPVSGFSYTAGGSMKFA